MERVQVLGERYRTAATRSAVLVALALAAACSGSSESATGPLGRSTKDPFAEVCAPITSDLPSLIEGETILHNTGEAPVTVASVELVEPSNLTLSSAHLYDSSNGFIGTLRGPPAEENIPGLTALKSPPGLEIAAGQKRGLLVHVTVQDTSRSGSARQLLVTYSAGQRTYKLLTGYTLIGAPDCADI